MPEMTLVACMGHPFRVAMRSLLATAMATALVCTLPAAHASAMVVSGVSLSDTATVGQQDLVVNGAGMRAVAMFRAYVVALYLPQAEQDPVRVMGMAGAKRLHLVTLRDLHGKDLGHSMRQTMEGNLSAAEAEALGSRLAALEVAMNGLGDLPKGAVIEMDYQPTSGSSVQVNGKVLLDQVPGADFYRAILLIWLGEHPVGANLKQALLGAAP